MTRLIYDEHDLPRPSMLDSMVAAKTTGMLDTARSDGYRDDKGICEHCGGTGYFEYANYGLSRCVCWTLKKEMKLRQTQRFATKHDRLEWSSFKMWGNNQSKADLSNVLASVQKWYEKIDKWMLLGGLVGTGKTHLLHILDTYLFPWSFYISVPDLKDIVFEYTAKRELQAVTDLIAKHPILLLDDLGAEYESEYSTSMVRQLIMERYGRWREYPVVVATNLTLVQLDNYDDRMADRLQDTEKVKRLSFGNVKSWRQYGN